MTTQEVDVLHKYIIIVGFAVVAGAAMAQATALSDPSALGPYPVGVTTTLAVDPSRQDDYIGGARALLTEIWYPATDDTIGKTPGRLLDYYLGATDPAIPMLIKMAFGADLAKADAAFKANAVRDAHVREGTFPLIVFSHGNGGMRSQNVFWCEHLASHGYIVVAPDHSGNCLMTLLDGTVKPYNDAGREQAAKDRPLDVTFLIDWMTRLNAGGDSRFLAKVDLEHVAVAGHSFGGYTAAMVAQSDDRVDAIVPMAGVSLEWGPHHTPVLMFLAGEDDTIGLEGNTRMRAYFDEATGPKYLVDVPDAGHYSFTEMYRYNPAFGDGVGEGTRVTNQEPLHYVTMERIFPVLNAYSTAFLGKFLKGLDGYDDYLDTNHAPDSVEFTHDAAKP